MKVLLAYQPGELRVVDMERPEPGPRDVLAKVLHCGICATDASIVRGTLNLGEGNQPIYPVRLGHEWSGEIVEAGSETARLKVGDRIISDTGYSCGTCDDCIRGDYGACVNGRAIGTTNHCLPGAFAEYMLIPERIGFRIPDHVGADEAALVEPASIALYGLLRAPLGPTHNLLVVGTGPIGLGGMACAKGMGAGKTILAGRKDAKLEIGRRMGADVVVNMTREDLREVVLRETGGRGMDVIMDTTGAPELFNELVGLLRTSGYLVIPGFYEQELEHVAIDRLIANNCTLVGAAGTANAVPRVLDLLANRHISLQPMITDRYPFERVKEGFAAVDSQNATRVKVLIDF